MLPKDYETRFDKHKSLGVDNNVVAGCQTLVYLQTYTEPIQLWPGLTFWLVQDDNAVDIFALSQFIRTALHCHINILENSPSSRNA